MQVPQVPWSRQPVQPPCRSSRESAIVDSVRYSRLFENNGPYPYPEHQLIDSLTAKLNAARPYWHIPGTVATRTVEKALGR